MSIFDGLLFRLSLFTSMIEIYASYFVSLLFLLSCVGDLNTIDGFCIEDPIERPKLTRFRGSANSVVGENF